MGIRIVSIGVYTPKNFVQVSQNQETSAGAELDALFTGGGKYHVASEQETSIYMGVEATKHALSQAGLSADQIDFATCFSYVPDYFAPHDLYGILRGAGCSKALAWPLDTACGSFLTHLSLAHKLSTVAGHRYMLLVETINWVDRAFGERPIINAAGDGAVAVIVECVPEQGSVLGLEEHTYTDQFSFITMKCAIATQTPSVLEFSNSHRVIHKSIMVVAETAKSLLASSGLTNDQLDWTLCHQPGMTAIRKWHEVAGLPVEKNLNTYALYGNVSAANIPLTIYHYTCVEPKIKRGDVLMMFSAGAGVHPVSVLLQY